ncbi:MAG: hypothetical protein ACW9W3_03300 [Candidatus Nitrosopumilus sp. bin_68KS]
MTTKDSTLLRRGIHSELFLLAYDKPESGYGIAQRHQDTTKRPDTSKIGNALDRLVTANYLHIKNKKYHPNFEKLSEDLFGYLSSKRVELYEHESKILKEMVKQNFIFLFLGKDVLYRMLIQPLRIHHIDALDVISNHIGMMCTFYKMLKNKNSVIISDEAKRKSISKISEELDDEISNVNEDMKKSFKGSKSIKKQKMSALDGVNSLMKSLILTSKILDKSTIETVEKLGNLWDQRDGFQIGIETSEKLRKFSV